MRFFMTKYIKNVRSPVRGWPIESPQPLKKSKCLQLIDTIDAFPQEPSKWHSLLGATFNVKCIIKFFFTTVRVQNMYLPATSSDCNPKNTMRLSKRTFTD